MKASEINKAKNPLLRLALPALERAAKNAYKQAMFHNTKLVIWRNDRIVKLTPSNIYEHPADHQADK